MVFTYQRWKKRQSEQRILNSLSDEDKSFSDLLELTGLSKSVLSERLESLTKQRKIKSVPEVKSKRFLYNLNREFLDEIEKGLILLHRLSKYVVDCLGEFARNPSISDNEYANRLIEGVSMLFNFRMLAHHTAPRLVQEEWLKTTLGLEFVKMMPELYPKNRKIFSYIFDGMSPKEQAIYESKDAKEAGKRLLEYLNMVFEKPPKE